MLLNLKGGVAKTTSVVAIAEALAEDGRSVLVLDADHQCMASELLIGADRLERCDRNHRTLHDLLSAMLSPDFDPDNFRRYVVKNGSNIGEGYPNLDVLPCSIRIDDFQTNVARARRGFHDATEFAQLLRRSMTALHRYLVAKYEFVLIDCPPSIPVQVRQFLRIADAFIIPCVPDTLSVRGALWLMERLRRMNVTRIQPMGTLWSLYRSQAVLHREVIQRTESGEMPYAQLPEPFVTIIPNAASVAAAMDPFIEERPSTFRQKYGTQAARLYGQVADEVVARCGRLGQPR